MQDLQVIVQEHGLEPAKAQVLMEKFSDVFKLAAEWEAKAKTLQVTAADQVAEMKMAREGRLFLKAKRVEVENTRKALKEEYVRGGKAVDGIANVLKAIIEPIEGYLEEQETFAARQEEQRLVALVEERKKQLAIYTDKYMFQDSMIKALTDDAFASLLAGEKAAFNKAQEEKQKAEEAERAAEQARKEQEEATRKENERLKAEALEREKQIKKQAAEAEKAQAVEREKARIAQEAALKAQKELAEKQAAEEAERLAAEKEAKKNRLAPDKQKLKMLAEKILATEMPELKNKEGEVILAAVQELLKKTADYILQKASNL